MVNFSSNRFDLTHRTNPPHLLVISLSPSFRHRAFSHPFGLFGWLYGQYVSKPRQLSFTTRAVTLRNPVISLSKALLGNLKIGTSVWDCRDIDFHFISSTCATSLPDMRSLRTMRWHRFASFLKSLFDNLDFSEMSLFCCFCPILFLEKFLCHALWYFNNANA